MDNGLTPTHHPVMLIRVQVFRDNWWQDLDGVAVEGAGPGAAMIYEDAKRNPERLEYRLVHDATGEPLPDTFKPDRIEAYLAELGIVPFYRTSGNGPQL